MKMIDITRPLVSKMTVWPGDEMVTIKCVSSIANGKTANISRIHMGVHAGTHVDAPLHFIDGGKAIEQLDIRLFTGWVQVVEINESNGITREQIMKCSITKGDAVFFKTPSSEHSLLEPFDEGFIGLQPDAALLLLKMGVRVIGTDALSIESYGTHDYSVHKTLLRNEVLTVEGLYLKNVLPGRYAYICMPMCIQGSDGAPARVILYE